MSSPCRLHVSKGDFILAHKLLLIIIYSYSVVLQSSDGDFSISRTINRNRDPTLLERSNGSFPVGGDLFPCLTNPLSEENTPLRCRDTYMHVVFEVFHHMLFGQATHSRLEWTVDAHIQGLNQAGGTCRDKNRSSVKGLKKGNDVFSLLGLVDIQH